MSGIECEMARSLSVRIPSTALLPGDGKNVSGVWCGGLESVCELSALRGRRSWLWKSFPAGLVIARW